MLGDLDECSKSSMSGKQIGTVLGHIGIKPEATRVALHRLKKDGWITTTKAGREVIYKLSKDGLEQTKAAYEDVYRESAKYPKGWKLALHNEKEANISENKPLGILLFKNVILAPIADNKNDDNKLALEFDRNQIPAWFEEQIVPRKIIDLAKRINLLGEQIQSAPNASSQLDCNVIRLLFLHNWRKMALRDSTWAHIWLSKNGPIAECHQHIVRILKLLPKIKFD